MVELTNRTRAHVRALFQASDIDAVEKTLATDCADNLPLLAHSSPHDLERVRFAVLRLSGGRLDALAKAVCLAQTDWRDLFLAAGFAHDTQAHARWEPRRFDSDVLSLWIAGRIPAGVTYSLDQSVSVQRGSEPMQLGSVISLDALEPEPRYLVKLTSGEIIEVFQRHLAAAK